MQGQRKLIEQYTSSRVYLLPTYVDDQFCSLGIVCLVESAQEGHDAAAEASQLALDLLVDDADVLLGDDAEVEGERGSEGGHEGEGEEEVKRG